MPESMRDYLDRTFAAQATTEVPVTCPCCQAEVRVTVNPGEEPTTYANGNHYPGCPPHIEDASCGCWDYLDMYGDLEMYERQLREVIGEVTRDDFVDPGHAYERMREDERPVGGVVVW